MKNKLLIICDNCELNNKDKQSLNDKLKEYENNKEKKIRDVINIKKK